MTDEIVYLSSYDSAEELGPPSANARLYPRRLFVCLLMRMKRLLSQVREKLK